MTAHLPSQEPHVASLDSLTRAVVQSSARVVAFTTPRHGIDVSGLAETVSQTLCDSDCRTLLIDFSQAVRLQTTPDAWQPGQAPDSNKLIRRNDSFDVFALTTDADSRPLFNNVQRLERSLQDSFPDYDKIVLILGPVLDADGTIVNPMSVARAAGSVIVVCATGRTSAHDATAVIDDLTAAGVNVAGTVLDETDDVWPGGELADLIDRVWLIPGSMRRLLGRLFRESELFGRS